VSAMPTLQAMAAIACIPAPVLMSSPRTDPHVDDLHDAAIVMPWVAAGASRWWYAERKVWTARASQRD